jgi:hypothetical protein
MRNLLKKSNKLYWWLIGTFAILYLAVAFVSTLHAITFFQLANRLGLAILLGAAYEVGQATVLFSILMSKNRSRMLAWAMMLLLTALQITANVYASFKYMDISQSTDWTYWQRAILFGVQAENPEMYKVIISWISGALLPLVALGMTALVADNIKIMQEEEEGKPKLPEPEPDDEDDKPLFGNLFKRKKKDEAIIDPLPVEVPTEAMGGIEAIQDMERFGNLKKDYDKLTDINENPPEGLGNIGVIKSQTLKEPIVVDLQHPDEHVLPDFLDEKAEIDISQFKSPGITGPEYIKNDGGMPKKIVPVNKMRGWHLFDEYVDDEHNVFKKGKFVEHDSTKTPTSKKA